MRKIIYILSLLFLAGCGHEESTFSVSSTGVTIRLAAKDLAMSTPSTKISDENNQPGEQIFHNISLFMTAPDNETITHRFIHAGFSHSGGYLQVSLPLEPSELGKRDIYVVANHSSIATLESVETIAELEVVQTPFVDKNNNLEPLNGFCMYGLLSGYDFTTADSGTALVSIKRTCAKYRVTLVFPDDASLSNENSLVIAGAANYTHIGEETGLSIPDNAYFNFINRIPLIDDEMGGYSAVTYVYEADIAPVIYIYINVDGNERFFSAALPFPERNYMYDIRVEIYNSQTRSANDSYTAIVSVNSKNCLQVTF